MNGMMNVRQMLENPVKPGGDWPRWFLDMVARDAAAFENFPLPQKSDERWRFGNPGMANLDDFIPGFAYSQENAAKVASKFLDSPLAAHRVVTVNGTLGSCPEELPEGLMIETLADFVKNDPSAQTVLESRFDSLGMERFVLLRSVLGGAGVVVKTKPGVHIADPVKITHMAVGEKALIAPITLILPGESSRVDILENHLGGEETAVLAIQRIHIPAGATVAYGLFQAMANSSKVVELGEAVLQENASLDFLSLHGGGRWIRQEIMCRMEGRGASANILSQASLDGSRELDQRTYQQHSCPGAKSNLLFKNVLRDQAKTTFSGMIRVEKGAHETDAYQRNLNLHLSKKAESNSMPGLEILADGVRCSHGAATAPIDPEHVFYLESRGIDRATAQDMIAEGFLEQVIQILEGRDSAPSWLPLLDRIPS